MMPCSSCDCLLFSSYLSFYWQPCIDSQRHAKPQKQRRRGGNERAREQSSEQFPPVPQEIVHAKEVATWWKTAENPQYWPLTFQYNPERARRCIARSIKCRVRHQGTPVGGIWRFNAWRGDSNFGRDPRVVRRERFCPICKNRWTVSKCNTNIRRTRSAKMWRCDVCNVNENVTLSSWKQLALLVSIKCMRSVLFTAFQRKSNFELFRLTS